MTKAQLKQAAFKEARDFYRANSLSETAQSDAYKLLTKDGLFDHDTAMAFVRTWKAQTEMQIPEVQGKPLKTYAVVKGVAEINLYSVRVQATNAILAIEQAKAQDLTWQLDETGYGGPVTSLDPEYTAVETD